MYKIASHAKELGADPLKGFIVGGESAGGNLADVCGHLARDENFQPPITGLLEGIPSLIGRNAIPALPDKYKDRYLAWEQNKEAPLLGRHVCEWFEGSFETPQALRAF